MKNASSYKLRKMLSEKDLRRFTPFWENMKLVRGLAAYAVRSGLRYINYFWERTYAHAGLSLLFVGSVFTP